MFRSQMIRIRKRCLCVALFLIMKITLEWCSVHCYVFVFAKERLNDAA